MCQVACTCRSSLYCGREPAAAATDGAARFHQPALSALTHFGSNVEIILDSLGFISRLLQPNTE